MTKDIQGNSLWFPYMTNSKDGCGGTFHLEKRLRRKVRASHIEGLLPPASLGGFNHLCLYIPLKLSIFIYHSEIKKKDDILPPSRTPSLPPPSSFGWRYPGPRTSPQRISVSGSTRSCLLRSGRGRDGPLGPAQTRTSRGRPVEDEVKARKID